MRTLAILMASAMTLGACGPRDDAPTPVEQAAAAPKSDAETTPPVQLTPARLTQVCRAALANIHGQTVAAVTIDGERGGVVDASWRAPVDGGVRRAQCRVDGDLVTWRPVSPVSPGEDRWMNQSGDPVTRFALDGDTIAITTTAPDGAAATTEYSVADMQEAA